MITRADEAVLAVLLSNPREEYNIRELSKATRVNYRLVYESVRKLAADEIMILRTVGKSTVCSINRKKNHALFSYVESVNLKKASARYKEISVIASELQKLEHIFYTALIFGSYARGKPTPKSDIDIMFILPDKENANSFEQSVKRLFYKLSYSIHISTTSARDFIEMLKRPDELNGANEALKNHIILYGGEQFFRMVAAA